MKNIHIPTIEELLRSDKEFGIEELSDGYRISGIEYRRKFCTYDFAKEALPKKTYEEHLNHAIATKDTQFRASEAPLVYAICKTLFLNKDGPKKELVENARKTLEGIIGPNKPLIATLSQAIYHTTGGGAFTHYYNHLEKYTNLPAEMTGPDGLITDPHTEADFYVYNLLNTFHSMQDINDIFKWITGKNTDVIRLNADPVTDKTHPVALGDSENPTFHLFAMEGKPERPALGVRPA